VSEIVFFTDFAPDLTQANCGLKRIADYSGHYYTAPQVGADEQFYLKNRL
jgi:hypothetical protein